MYRFCPIVRIVFTLFLAAWCGLSQATVTVTPASGNCLNNTPGAFTAIGSIVINEGAMADFAVQTGATFILSAPSGFEFNAGVGSVSVTASRNITSPTISVTASTITVTYDCGGTNKADRMTISGIQMRGLTAGSAGNILRTGGTATITGDNVVNAINHGTLTSNGTGVTVNTIANGNWSSPAIWSSGAVPSCGQNVIINNTVTADIAASPANLTISTGAVLTTTSAITVSGTFTISGTGSYIHNNASDASTTIFAGTESIATTSTMTFQQWYNLNVPLGNMITGNLGNVTFSVAGTWSQDGSFAPSKIKGTTTITAGTVVFDDGTGATTSLTLQDVNLSGSGNLIACSGSNRNFTFVTNNFTDAGTDASQTTIMSSCTGTLSWTVNGSVSLADIFKLDETSGSPASVTMSVSGNLNITGGSVDFLESTDAPLTLTVTGNTNISGSPGHVSLVNSGSGALIFNTGSLNVSIDGTVSLVTGSFSGTNQFNITNDIALTGATASLYMVNIEGYTPTVNVTTGRDVLVTNGDFYVANTNGPVALSCGRYMTITGASSVFNGQSSTTNASLTSVVVSGTFTITNATYYHTMGEGNITLTVGESLTINNGSFYGLNHTTGPSAATATFNFQDFTFRGGIVKFFTLKTSAPTLVTVNCTNNFDIIWQANTDLVELVSYDGNNDAALSLTIGGNFSIAGNYSSAYFLSSKAGGSETVAIGGSFSVSGGTAFFVCDNTSTNGVDAHQITTTIGGNIDISGGTTFLSTRDGNATVTVTGDVNISAGILNLKWLDGIGLLTIGGAFNQTGGTYNMHSHTASNDDTCKVVVNGSFSQTGGTFNFDNASSGAEHTLTINGPSYTVGGSAVITHVNNLSTTYLFGQIYFNRAGTITYSRTSSTHNIEHVRQTINAGTTVNASASSNGFQMTSVASSTVATHNALTIYGTLDMGAQTLSARQQANYYSRLTVAAGGRYRTSHTGGFYSGSNVIASSINGYMLTLNRVSYNLAATSTVEYYGTSTSVVTGVPNGIATAANHQYGILEINFTGAAGTTWVTPQTTDEVHIRTSLVMTAGEFNLDNDHVTSGGGKVINLEAGATTSRTAGFVRSETEDGSGSVKWNITSNSTNVFPFGYDASNYIPFTFQQTSGSAGIVELSTYRSLANNTPYPPTVTHVRDVLGNDNSAATVDRFWKIVVPGTVTASLTYTYAVAEGTGIVSPRAQRWEPVIPGWYPPAGVQSNPTATSTTAAGLTAFNTWWTLSSLGSPLPIELTSFEVEKAGLSADITWITQSEINNDYFTIERSSDGVHFENIRQLNGAGNSTSPIHYEFVDESPFTGINYYRLKQTDFDGRFTYSEIRSISFNKKGSFAVYPNPATVTSSISVEVAEKGVNTIVISDVIGKTIFNRTIVMDEDKKFTFTPGELQLADGMYTITVTGTTSTGSKKILVTGAGHH